MSPYSFDPILPYLRRAAGRTWQVDAEITAEGELSIYLERKWWAILATRSAVKRRARDVILIAPEHHLRFVWTSKDDDPVVQAIYYSRRRDEDHGRLRSTT
jgi:hypothetical protein